MSVAACLFAAALAGAPAFSLDAAAERFVAPSVRAYEWFHANPELSGNERQTAAKLAEHLRAIGMEVHTDIGGHGILAVLRGNGDGPVVLYRADMDALPVSEQTGLPYASKNPGVMHACGHDVHMATAVGVLSALAAARQTWRGTVLFVGQPAEETGAGAKAVLASPVFKDLLAKLGKPAVALALHDSGDLAAGHVSLLAGYTHANVDSVDIVIHGRGGHGAQPNQTVDPIVIGAHVVTALQTLVSRRTAPGERAVVTVGAFNGGTKHNIIPSTAELKLTVRSYSDALRRQLLQGIRDTATNVARGLGATRDPEVLTRDEYTPAVYNDPTWTGKLRARLVELLGQDKVHTHEPTTYGEDFGAYGRELGVPAVMYALGAADPKWLTNPERPALHSDRWAPLVEPTLRAGIRTMHAAIVLALQQ